MRFASGQQRALGLAVTLALAGCANETVQPFAGVGRKPPSPISTASGTTLGSSFDTAVVIRARSESEGVPAEYVWLKEHRPGAQVEAQALARHKGKPFDILTIR